MLCTSIGLLAVRDSAALATPVQNAPTPLGGLHVLQIEVGTANQLQDDSIPRSAGVSPETAANGVLELPRLLAHRPPRVGSLATIEVQPDLLPAHAQSSAHAGKSAVMPRSEGTSGRVSCLSRPQVDLARTR